jgi:hypothetical protein
MRCGLILANSRHSLISDTIRQPLTPDAGRNKSVLMIEVGAGAGKCRLSHKVG